MDPTTHAHASHTRTQTQTQHTENENEDEYTTKSQKACWVPFQKQIHTRRTVGDEHWEIGNPSRLLCKSNSSDFTDKATAKNLGNKTQTKSKIKSNRRANKNGKSKTKKGSVSTGTPETDMSFLSEESRLTAKTETSTPQRNPYMVRRSFLNSNNNNNNGNNNLPSPLRFDSRLRSELPSNRRILRQGKLYDDDDDDDESILANNTPTTNTNTKNNRQLGYLGGGDDFLSAMNLSPIAKIETNCMAKEFWTDEVVEGGALACIESREEKKKLAYLLLRDVRRSDNNNVGSILDGEPEVGTGGGSGLGSGKKTTSASAATTKGQNKLVLPKTEQNINTNTNNTTKMIHSFGSMMRFVSQDPEETNDDGAPLRRILCSNAPFRKAPMLCRGREHTAVPRLQHDVYDSNTTATATATATPATNRSWQNRNQNKHGDGLDEEATNFYVEVEAMGDRLNGIRDLEEFEGESMESKTRRQKQQQQQQTTSTRSSKDHIILYPHDIVGRNGERNDRCFQTTDKKTSSSTSTRAQTAKSKGQRKAERQHERIDRQNQLLSEMVTDRVFAMRTGNDIGSDSMGRDRNESTYNNLRRREPSRKSSHRTHKRRVESPPRMIARSTAGAAASFNPLNVSELTDVSYDRGASNLRTGTASMNNNNNKAVRRKSSGNARQARDKNNDVSPRRDHDMDGGNFDDNFWKEDDDVDSAAFEIYGSENDSVFDDLKSLPSTRETIYPTKNSKDESQPFEDNARVGKYRVRKSKERFSMRVL